MRYVESVSVSGIAFTDQLLLSLDVRLEPQKLLSAFGLPASDHREVFVFNKAMLQSNSNPPSPEEVVDLQEVDDALPPASLHDPHPLDDALDPSPGSYMYEVHDKNHLPKMHACYNSVSELLDCCKNKKNGMNKIHMRSESMNWNNQASHVKLGKMNCPHVVKCLHEAREEAQTHLCAADRRASEYNTLRASSVKMRGHFERLRSSVCAGGGVALNPRHCSQITSQTVLHTSSERLSTSNAKQ
ncbi:hypothetical protein Rs2_37617 [Raphanus sativus]|nr:hypothetical protein Rs2_37617 [Raphanus sativus]